LKFDGKNKNNFLLKKILGISFSDIGFSVTFN